MNVCETIHRLGFVGDFSAVHSLEQPTSILVLGVSPNKPNNNIAFLLVDIPLKVERLLVVVMESVLEQL